MLPDQEKYAISVSPTSPVGSADSSGAAELEGVSDSEGVWGDGSEELITGSEVPPSLEVAPPPLHAARENTNVMDNKSDNIFFILAIPFFFRKEQLFRCSDRLVI